MLLYFRFKISIRNPIKSFIAPHTGWYFGNRNWNIISWLLIKTWIFMKLLKTYYSLKYYQISPEKRRNSGGIQGILSVWWLDSLLDTRKKIRTKKWKKDVVRKKNKEQTWQQKLYQHVDNYYVNHIFKKIKKNRPNLQSYSH